MSILVSVAIAMQEGDTTYVQVLRAETVLPVEYVGDSAEKSGDLIDLARAACDRLVSEAAEKADAQIEDFRALLKDMG